MSEFSRYLSQEYGTSGVARYARSTWESFAPEHAIITLHSVPGNGFLSGMHHNRDLSAYKTAGLPQAPVKEHHEGLGRNLESSNSTLGTEVCSNRKRHHGSLILLKHLLHAARTSAKVISCLRSTTPFYTALITIYLRHKGRALRRTVTGSRCAFACSCVPKK